MDYKIKDFIGVFDGVFSPEYCTKVIDYFERMEEAGYAIKRQQQETSVIETLKNDTISFTVDYIYHFPQVVDKEFQDVFWTLVYPAYADEYPILKTIESHKIFSNKLQRTKKGQGYHVWHCENGRRDTAHRVLVYIVYLNDVEDGGETEFLYQSQRIKPVTGRVVVWPAGFTHTHRGNPPLTNTKYIMTGWIELC